MALDFLWNRCQKRLSSDPAALIFTESYLLLLPKQRCVCWRSLENYFLFLLFYALKHKSPKLLVQRRVMCDWRQTHCRHEIWHNVLEVKGLVSQGGFLFRLPLLASIVLVLRMCVHSCPRARVFVCRAVLSVVLWRQRGCFQSIWSLQCSLLNDSTEVQYFGQEFCATSNKNKHLFFLTFLWFLTGSNAKGLMRGSVKAEKLGFPLVASSLLESTIYLLKGVILRIQQCKDEQSENCIKY